jgi:hypothetical protein
MALRAVAVAAPDRLSGSPGRALTSGDPASLFNACRHAAAAAARGAGAWGESNWAVPRLERRRRLLLMHSWNGDVDAFEALLRRERPNLLLIGAMSLCLPGAIACARLAKELFGERICVVLGGRHASETIYATPDDVVHQHPGSPLRLMAAGRIDPVFDLVASGEGEALITAIGEQVDALDRRGKPAADARLDLVRLASARGRYLVGRVDGERILVEAGRAGPLERNALPPPSRMFGVTSSFGACFGHRLTAHVFSDTGNGCVYDCKFCSERIGVTGPLAELSTAATRLHRQLASAVEVVAEDSPELRASAFVEDSTL